MKSKWKTKKLGEVCDVIGGGTPSKSKPEFYRGEIPWATVRDMRNDLLKVTELKITPDAVSNSSTNIIPGGNIVIATRVGLGKVCLLKTDTAINQDLKGIIPKDPDQLSPLFLFWWFKSIGGRIVMTGTGATVQGVKLTFIKDLDVPVPPIAEQKKIVKFLEDAFKDIEKAQENMNKNIANLEELKNSVLFRSFKNRNE